MNPEVSLIKSLVTTLISEINPSQGNEKLIRREEKINLPEKISEFEIKLIKFALVKTGGNQRRAARFLGLKVTTLHNKIKKYNIKYPKFTEDY